MRVLLTGGGGYLGTCAAQRLLDEGHTVRIFDRFCFGEEAVAALRTHGQCEIVSGDIRRLHEFPALMKDIEAVIHLAGLANDPSCDLNPDMAEDVNVESSLELARLASQLGVRRFVLASSCTVYGRGVFAILDESSPANPVSTFGKTKLSAEKAVLSLKTEGFEPVIARLGTLFGVSPRMRFDLAVNQMVATALRQGHIIVRGGGSQWRPFIHVSDAARALHTMMEAPAEKVSGRVFNTGDSRLNYQIGDLAEKVAASIGGIQVELAKDDDDLRNFRVQFDRIWDTLGFSCMTTLEQGIQEVRAWLNARPECEPFDEQYFNVGRMKRLLATPVDEGGEPVAARFIPLGKPSLGPEEEQAVLETLRSGWLTSGAHLPAFESAFSKTVEAPYTIAVNSCTAALHLCLVDMGVGPGDEVITAPITWVSTANTIVNMGAKPVFVDVQPDTLNLDPELLEAAITSRTKAIMPVHLAGHPADMTRIRAIAAKHGIPIVEDAAHALGARYRGACIGAYSEYTCFSFYAIKNITTMEGGMISTMDADRAERLRRLAFNGLSATAWDRYGRSSVPHPLEVAVPGYKYIMGNVSAAMGLEQLKKFETFKAARKRVANMYQAVLAEVDEIDLPPVREYIDHAWHLYVIQLNLDRLSRTRDEIAYDLRRENVGSGIHFYGLHLHQWYREHLGLSPESFPESTRASNCILSIPLHPQITDKNVQEVVAALKKVLHHAKKMV
ncbi:MAG: aminotransferase class I/II-fold pyridoxal phosphate-dependent enzyme [Candidatus Hydrogenedentes bacterium]|nr:aminotransferase class I/II-fold pyridoxal phosphate-dependent enzyme [Candidatus Hydrogenedentota bacterium]